ncbi:hypothetical protein BCR33DRAFT_822124 [Rhizoclosmatium globosum]|uniref:Uncharacterized protein n=1 Tax=Rhizoclosmatium globosum TaxID=329046 RepID=A0A1Y2A7K6_9FUNG|nr:hypothetical protein BCR33DRAFT_822124 [Rhizoclosmatium globosum]|eukprot:ORY18471.1 hypothetical protein BCR33DRAFT_822124 [Rhizoclosmatium globosum]
MPLDVLGRTRATMMEAASNSPWPEGPGIPSKRKSSACVDYVPALCTHRPSLLPIEWLSETSGSTIFGPQGLMVVEKLVKLDLVNHRVFERILHPLVFRGVCLFENRLISQDPDLISTRRPAELKHINKRRKRNQQGFP